MRDFKNSHLQMIEKRADRAAEFAVGNGFKVEISGSVLKICNARSSASLLFRSDHIVVEQLGVELGERRRHFGSTMIDLVIAIANQAGLRLELIAESPFRPNKADLSQTDLQAWYRRREFVDCDDALMTRLPDGNRKLFSFTVA
jgi:hypothetical protein